ncbi:Binding protein [Citrus sinensis]|uniref:Binding protein n=1 Tax=Citrus sinensis TaxID=2711 RepID=A0ACB8I9S3_CITSI|nr:Binding protein [Citrus sinensis]
MGAQEKSQANANPMQRVKVYRLNDDGKWDDQGTGHVTVDSMERSEELCLFVIDEEDNETILLHRISPDDIYRKQEGETFHSMNSELRELPPIELSTLPLILKTVTESGIADQMRLTELILNDQDFFRKLMDLFRICEDLENIDGLHMIFKIIKGIILLNSPQIFEKIFGDELMMDIIGSLEYDPDVPHVQHHRNFLKEHVVFKEAIPIRDPLVLSKIHQTYRVGYLKDVVLARVLDEATVANLNSIIHGNNAYVVSLLKDDSTFIQELFARLRSPTTLEESKKNLVHFLHEFCGLSKSLQMVQQLRLFRYAIAKDLMNEGIFDIVTDALQSQDKKLVLTGTDILILFLNQDPNLLRSYVVRQEGIPLLGLLVKGMITDFGEDMHCQFLEILRSLLDSYTLSGAQTPCPQGGIQETAAMFLSTIICANSIDSPNPLGLSKRSAARIFSFSPFIKFPSNTASEMSPRHPKPPCLGRASAPNAAKSPSPATLTSARPIPMPKHRFPTLNCLLQPRNPQIHHPQPQPSLLRHAQRQERLPATKSAVNCCPWLRKTLVVFGPPPFVPSSSTGFVSPDPSPATPPWPVDTASGGLRCNFLLNNVVDKVLLLTRRREKYLVVAAVRFVRTILSRHDEHLINHFVKNNLLKPIVDAFVANGNRYNLLNSAVLELFEYIRKENLKSLVKYIVDSFWNQLVNFEYLASLHSFKVKYEQCLESSGTNNNFNSVDPRKRNDERALEKEEEDYFNDSDEEDTASASHTQRAQAQPVLSNGVAASYSSLSPRSGGLVDYDDDEDDEDYRPPPRKQSETLEEDEGTMDSLRLKRKSASSKEKEPELVKKQRLSKNPKSRDSVFAALCSTLSQAVLPSKKNASSMQLTPHTDDRSKGVGEQEDSSNSINSSNNSSSDEEIHRDKEPTASRSCSDCMHGGSDNRQLSGEDCALIPPKSSPEMAVNGT